MSTHLKTLLSQFDSDSPLQKARTIPSAWYFDPELHAHERKAVFGNSWQAVGRADQIAKSGDYFTADIAGEPVLVVRGDDGEIRAFHNVCRHRAAQVMNEPQGNATKLRCRYHGWTYDLCGRLRGVPEFDGVEDFRREDNGLAQMAVDVFGPFVFVHPGQPTQSLEEYLKPFPEMTRDFNLGDLHFVERREYELACNWKVFVDNYQDGGYHVNTVHPSLAGALDYSRYRTEVFENTTVQISPMRVTDDQTVGKVRSGENAYYWWIFPNFMVNVYEGVLDTNLVLPLGPDRCRVVFDFYFAETETAEAIQFNAESIAVAHQIQLEDWGICEEVQQGLKSRSYETGRFSVKREAGGYHFHRLLARALRNAAS